jgi:hypothetical protein
MDDRSLITMLIDVGKTGEVPAWLKPFNRFYIGNPPTSWQIADRLSFENLVFLIKGLTLAQKEFSWIGGDKTRVIWLFQYVEEHYPEAVESIANWVLEHRGNEYIPYGVSGLYMPTHAENMELAEEYKQQWISRQRQIAYENEEMRQRAERNRLERANTARDRGTDRHTLLLAKLARMSHEEQLEYIANDNQYSIGMYPKSIATAPLGNVDANLKWRLLDKIVGKLRGPWSKFRKRLIEYKP